MGKHRKQITIALREWFDKAYPVKMCNKVESDIALEYIEDVREMLNGLEREYKERQAFLAMISPEDLPKRDGIDY